ncbi:hypothetical protein FQN57_001376 [Myotisia sp. PD_48]|nr:hypothetical protein FQN57_001376 [Myotisia sp. PD_48]
MAERALSRTLPKDFLFYPPNEPRTPNRPVREPAAPPRPNHASYRVRRRRIERKPIPFSAPDIPLPSVECPPISGDTALAPVEWNDFVSSGDAGFLAVPRQRIDPITPPAQIQGSPSDTESSWAEEINPALIGGSISRPASACSNASDSSFTSATSYLSHPSYGGSCTSPESELDDPFFAIPLPDNKQNLETPSKAAKYSAVPLHVSNRHCFNSEMDSHLWNTYQTYLQDPKLTPFKMLPGSLPPLGVSHRVAREARKAWMKKHGLPELVGDELGDNESLNSSTTIKPWPRSDAATRRRLKQLCKRKHSIAPHYQRLLQSHSPSPPPELLNHVSAAVSGRPEISHESSEPFTRDLGISLVAGNIPSGAPGTGSDDSNNTTPTASGGRQIYPSIPSSAIYKGNSSLQASAIANSQIPRLGSPFMYHTWGPARSRRHIIPSSPPVEAHDTVHITGSRLRSGIPPDLFTTPQKPGPVPADEDARPKAVKNHSPRPRKVRVRSRGITTGTLNSRERLVQLFTPPSNSGSNMGDNYHPQSSSDWVDEFPSAEGIKRLGSPFNLDLPASKRSQQYSRHVSSRSDPFITSGVHYRSLQFPSNTNENRQPHIASPPMLPQAFEPSDTDSTPRTIRP